MGNVILGINLSHDMSCAAVVDGQVVVAIEEERLVRIKHCDGKTHLGQMIPFAALRYCLEVLDIDPQDVGLWVANATSPDADRILRERLIGINPERVCEVPFPGHHLAHAVSAFYPSHFREAAVLVVDVNGSSNGHEKENYSIYHGQGESLELIFQDFVTCGEAGIGDLYTIYAAILQLSPMSDGAYGADDPHSSGGKLMGYAAYGSCITETSLTKSSRSSVFKRLLEPSGNRFTIKIPQLVEHLLEQGRIKEVVAEERLTQIFASRIQHCVRWNYRSDSLEATNNIAFAHEAQALLEETVVRMAEHAYAATGCANLCLAGGTTLNTAAAHRILAGTPIRNIFVQPAANDAGTAIGAALYGYYLSAASPQRFYLERPYATFFGRQYSATDIDAALADCSISASLNIERLATEAEQADKLIRVIQEGKIVAVFKGRSEFGPRALGNRSLLACPRHRETVLRMNSLKKREWYRPLAPVVLESKLHSYFDAPFSYSPFMTINARCRPETAELAPAICHIDGSARVQTVSPQTNYFLFGLLERYAADTGRPPILVNTSFNISEPIVETPRDALRTFIAAQGEIHHLLLEDRFVSFAIPLQSAPNNA